MKMIRMREIRNYLGVTLVELLVAIAIISILAAIGVPEYGRFVAKNRVRSAASDLLQNMRLTRTMAIKENREYLITFNEAGSDSYSIGFDGNGDNKLTDPSDGYGTGAVRTYDLESSYGSGVQFGTSADEGPDEPDACPACLTITGSTVAFGGTAAPVRQEFNPDGTISFTGSVYITTATRGFTYMLRISNQAGKIDLWKWDGDNETTSVPLVNQCSQAPLRYCRWTELR
jgi:prepilin-type N-terminal cleavage/methylation domain-containing protein